MTDLNSLLERADRAVSGVPLPTGGLERLLRRRDRKRRNQRIAAGIVGIVVFVAAVWIVTTGGPFDRTISPAATTGATVPQPAAVDVNGLPPEGAPPSTPEHGELVLQLEATESQSSVWVYADGRLISREFDQALEPYSGLVEQHLTPEGVEFLRSNVISTGLFDRDLELRREDEGPAGAPLLAIQVRNGDRSVSVRWAWRYALQDPEAPHATPQQATALESLQALLTDPTSWPSGAWADQQIGGYVPTIYSVCSRGFPEVEPSRVLTLLPVPARDLLGAGFMNTDGSEQKVDCSRMTTEEARALAGILDAAGFVRDELAGGPLRYTLEGPEVPGTILIAFEPVLPHGEAFLEGLG